jgi:hypothetical protein
MFDVAFATFFGFAGYFCEAFLSFLSLQAFKLAPFAFAAALSDYVPRKRQLEVKNGILATRLFVLVPSGF